MEQSFTDLLIRIRKGSRVTYPVEAWLGDGSFYEGELRLTSALRRDLLIKDFEPLAYGEMLFEHLFDGDIATAYDVATGLARQRSERRLRLRLLLDEGAPAELHAIKWERLADLQGHPLGIDGNTPLSRYTALRRPEPGPLDEAVVRLLFVVSSPNNLANLDLAPLDVEAELDRLLDALGEVWRNERCQATILPGRSGLRPALRARLEAAGCTIAGGHATLDNVGRHLRDGRHHALHFLGHGQYAGGHGYLLLEDEAGALNRVVDTALAAELGNTPLRLVFLAACESARRDAGPAAGQAPARAFQGLAGRLVQDGGIAAVVAMQAPIDVDAAYRLAGEFYRRLFLDHGVVDRALNEARSMLYAGREKDWGTPVLTMRLKTGQLARPNPAWSALRAIGQHSDYSMFRSERYVDLPIQATLVDEDQDVGRQEEGVPQTIGTLDLLDAILSHLASGDGGADPGDAAAPLVLVLGGPSTGKSTQMKRLGWQTVRAGLKAPAGQFFLPLYLDLQEYRPGG
ncbi:MAG: CHAT domain-containing protein, partial [Anaerolineae bacterium]